MTTPAKPEHSAPTLIAPNWWLGILPRDLWWRKKIAFSYESDFQPLAAGLSTAEVVTQIQTDSDFFCLGLNILITTVANPPVLLWGSGFTNNFATGVTIQIRDLASAQNFFSSPVPIDNVAGSGPFPAPLGFPYLFTSSSSISTTLVNLLGGVAKNVSCTYWGVRIYKFKA